MWYLIMKNTKLRRSWSFSPSSRKLMWPENMWHNQTPWKESLRCYCMNGQVNSKLKWQPRNVGDTKTTVFNENNFRRGLEINQEFKCNSWDSNVGSVGLPRASRTHAIQSCTPNIRQIATGFGICLLGFQSYLSPLSLIFSHCLTMEWKSLPRGIVSWIMCDFNQTSFITFNNSQK